MPNEKGEEVGIIYGWYNTLTDMWYIGQTINEEGRFKSHIYNAITRKDNSHFYKAIRKYGLENFIYCVLEENILRENLNMKEQEWIEYYDSFYCGYNMTAGGGQTIFCEEIKNKISIALTGKHLSEEHKENISKANKGRITSPETKKKLSEQKIGNKNPRYGKPGINKGKKFSIEWKKKLSESHKGRDVWNKGKHGIYSEETLKKMSESSKGKHPSDETKKKISNGLKGRPSPFKGKTSPKRKKVLKYDLNGNFIKEYTSMTEAAKENPKCGKNICAVCQGKRRQAGGFIWKYA